MSVLPLEKYIITLLCSELTLRSKSKILGYVTRKKQKGWKDHLGGHSCRGKGYSNFTLDPAPPLVIPHYPHPPAITPLLLVKLKGLRGGLRGGVRGHVKRKQWQGGVSGCHIGHANIFSFSPPSHSVNLTRVTRLWDFSTWTLFFLDIFGFKFQNGYTMKSYEASQHVKVNW